MSKAAKMAQALLDEGLLEYDDLETLVRDNMFGMGNHGICLACGAEHDGCEDDAEGYPCDECGKPWVYGAGAVFMMIA